MRKRAGSCFWLLEPEKTGKIWNLSLGGGGGGHKRQRLTINMSETSGEDGGRGRGAEMAARPVLASAVMNYPAG